MTKNPPHNIDTKACRGKMRKQIVYHSKPLQYHKTELRPCVTKIGHRKTDIQTTDDMQTDKRQSQMKRKGTQKQG